MGVRKIVFIDEEKCNGCGNCILDCHEGALKIVNGKAKIINDVYCDGLGDCLKGCPVDAISIVEREAVDFSEEAVKKHLENKEKVLTTQGGCLSSKFKVLEGDNSSLTQWPVQLKLLNPAAPYFKEADLLVTADCVPFAYKEYHNDFLQGRKVCVGCPKLDDLNEYIEKIGDIIKVNKLNSITVLRMEVPCCGGIVKAVNVAREKVGVNININVITISVNGEVIKEEVI